MLSTSLVNMLHTTPTNHLRIWKIVRETRKKLVSPNSECYDAFLNDQLIAKNIDEVGKHLETNEAVNFLDHLEDSKLKTANEMLTFLSFCPDRNSVSLLSLYTKILKQSSTEIVVFFANIFKLMSQNPTASKYIAEDLWEDISKIMDLQNLHLINEFTQRESIVRQSMFGNCTTECKEKMKILGIVSDFIPFHILISSFLRNCRIAESNKSSCASYR